MLVFYKETFDGRRDFSANYANIVAMVYMYVCRDIGKIDGEGLPGNKKEVNW